MRREKYDSAEKIQSFLASFTSSTSRQNQLKWCAREWTELWNGFAILQREVYLKEEVAALEKSQKIQHLTEEQRKQLKALKDELQKVDRDWWFHRRDINSSELKKPKGPRIRLWDTQGENPKRVETRRKWRMARGGCCDYDCGCCKKVRNEQRSEEFSHCSPEDCGCCIRRRGSRKIPEKSRLPSMNSLIGGSTSGRATAT